MSAIRRAALLEASALLLQESMRMWRESPNAFDSISAYVDASNVVRDLATMVPDGSVALSLFPEPDSCGSYDMFGGEL